MLANFFSVKLNIWELNFSRLVRSKLWIVVTGFRGKNCAKLCDNSLIPPLTPVAVVPLQHLSGFGSLAKLWESFCREWAWDLLQQNSLFRGAKEWRKVRSRIFPSSKGYFLPTLIDCLFRKYPSWCQLLLIYLIVITFALHTLIFCFRNLATYDFLDKSIWTFNKICLAIKSCKNWPSSVSLSLFSVFSNKHFKFYSKLTWIIPFRIWCGDLNSQPLEYESSPITTSQTSYPNIKNDESLDEINIPKLEC